jgi:HNH endonuclease
MAVPPRRTTRQVFPPVNRCIYCDASNVELTDEHIIPFSLGGIMELPKSSCKPCAKITHAFEYTCARQIFGKFRIRHNIKTRRKKERPTHLTALATDSTGNPKEVILRAADYPTELFLYKFKIAKALIGMPPSANIPLEWEPIGIGSHDEMVAFEKRHGGAFTARVVMQPIEFGRLLAKIAHSYAVAELGLNSFFPLTLDVILGRTDDISYVVGGSYEIAPRVPDAGHLTSIEYRVDPYMKKSLIIVNIRLFASIHTPSYHVVVGRIQEAQHVTTLFDKLQNSPSVQFMLPPGKFHPR